MRRRIDGLRSRASTTRLLVGLALIAPAALLQLDDRFGSGMSAGHVAGTTPADSAAAELRARAENARLDAIFARHYDIPLDLASRIHDAARNEGIDPVVAFGLVRTESSFRRTAVSYVGAVGYTQLMPSTARWMDPEVGRRDLFRPEVNLRIGFQYLRYLLDKYDGDMRLALTAYNRGPGTVDRLVKRGRDPENGYADKVLDELQDRRNGVRAALSAI